MSTGKKVLEPYLLVSAGNMSADIISASFNVKNINDIGMQLVFTGSPTGSFFVQASVDGNTWGSITTSPASISAAGAGGNHEIDLEGYSFPYIRLFYDFTSGTGSLNVYISGKGN